ncbi:MAG: LD-carboxypeptidase [Polyangia bacterium]
MRAPTALRPGDPIVVVAPSGPVPEARYRAGLERLAARYDVRSTPRIFERTGYLAGGDDARLAELDAAFASDAKAIVCARGGYGLMRLLARLAPVTDKLVVGFSDVTALHAVMARAGVRSVHGPVVTQLGELPDDDVSSLWALLEGSLGAPIVGLDSAGTSATVEGCLVGGNIELVSSLVGTPWAYALRGNVLLLEEIGERPYRIDRQLTQLLLTGALDGVVAIVVGDLVDCNAPEGPTALEVVTERLRGLGVPILTGLPVGHGSRNRALAHGARVRVEPGRLTFLEPAAQ